MKEWNGWSSDARCRRTDLNFSLRIAGKGLGSRAPIHLPSPIRDEEPVRDCSMKAASSEPTPEKKKRVAKGNAIVKTDVLGRRLRRIDQEPVGPRDAHPNGTPISPWYSHTVAAFGSYLLRETVAVSGGLTLPVVNGEEPESAVILLPCHGQFGETRARVERPIR